MPINVNKLSEVFGKDVFTDRGDYCGKVSNVKVDLNKFRIGSIVLRARKGGYLASLLGGKKGVVVPYQFLKAVGDIVIIKHINPDTVGSPARGRGEEEELRTSLSRVDSEGEAEEFEEEEEDDNVSLPF